MVTPYLAQQPVDDFGQRFSDLKYSATLAITTDTAFTVPGNAQRYKALIKVEGAGHVWAAINAAAGVPASAAFAATASELVPQNGGICREVRSGDVLHFYTATANIDVSVVLYAVGTNN